MNDGAGSAWRRYSSGNETAAGFARVDLHGMTPAELLAEGRAVGLTVRADGDRLVVRGPRRTRELAELLVSRKAELLPLVQGEPSAPQVQMHTEPEPVPAPWDEAAASLALTAALARVDHLKAQSWWSQAQQSALDVFRVLFERYHASKDVLLFDAQAVLDVQVNVLWKRTS